MSALADRIGVPKSSVHAAFGTKEDLQIQVLRETRAVLISKVVIPSLAVPAGDERLVALGESWCAYLESGVFEGGCVLSAASSELDGRPGPVRDELAGIMAEWLQFLGDNVRSAIADGTYAESIDAEHLAFDLNGIGMAANWHFQLFGTTNAFVFARDSWTNALARAGSSEAVGGRVASRRR
jgi:AcrR family transcriptional regulator